MNLVVKFGQSVLQPLTAMLVTFCSVAVTFLIVTSVTCAATYITITPTTTLAIETAQSTPARLSIPLSSGLVGMQVLLGGG